MYLISPAPEYEQYLRLHRKWREDWRYTTEKTPSVDLQIPLEWLKEELQAKWQPISFDVRMGTQTYTLSWLITIEGFNLLGGLHRDGYAVVVTGHSEATHRFALWYRSIFADHDLYLYEWASPGIKLHHNMTLEKVREAVNKQYTSSHQETEQSQ